MSAIKFGAGVTLGVLLAVIVVALAALIVIRVFRWAWRVGEGIGDMLVATAKPRRR